MTALDITVEGLSSDLIETYIRSGMMRGRAGEKTIRWTFAHSDRAFAVARTNGAISGVSAYIRTRMKFGDSSGEGYQAVDSFVAENMRGRGVFGALARAYDAHVRENNGDLVWGFPNDNAAPAWFGKLGWHKHGQVPMLVKPLRAGYILRKLRLPMDFPLARGQDQNISPVDRIEGWADTLWDRYARNIGCATIRDAQYLSHRLCAAPQGREYRVVAASDHDRPALVATSEARKHGGHIAYLMEGMGDEDSLRELLVSELARLRDRGVEIALAWSYPWSPNRRILRRMGFLPLPEKWRPIRIWFGSYPHSAQAKRASESGQWYLSYLDSDTV